ncbi:glycosyltransferase family 2 protein [Eisenbergiella tayi]|uniref:glycosyltransferase family 2 protein n=1 Tax=Eisenbergiella tayi TaxID=1432052 RepID=UPI0008493C48|nr:glycosyltransferase family 2 protein [Eisenbergiella tayi]ODR35236.1 hypothetical protein BEI60_19440 [Eisenbergiella tayi]
MPSVSVIIPIYNAGAEIEKCLNSLTNQTYKDFEVIAVDDHSTDNTFSVVNKYIARDCRIKIYTNEKKGVSSARNFGIKKATGKFLIFVDADDQVSPVFIQMLVTMMIEDNCDCAAISFVYSLNKLEHSINPSSISTYTDFSVYKPLSDISGGVGGYVCNKIYCANIIKGNNIWFDESILVGEDLLFNFKYFNYVIKLEYSNQGLYYYKLNTTSAVNSLTNPKWFDLLTVYGLIINTKNPNDVVNAFKFNYALLIMEGIYRVKYCPDAPYKLNELKRMKKEHIKLNRNFGVKNNLKLLMILLLPKVSMRYRRRAIKDV